METNDTNKNKTMELIYHAQKAVINGSAKRKRTQSWAAKTKESGMIKSKSTIVILALKQTGKIDASPTTVWCRKDVQTTTAYFHYK